MQNLRGAGLTLDSLLFIFPDLRSSVEVIALRSRLTSRSAVKVGLALPLMRTAPPSAMKEVGNDVYEGMTYAVEQYAADAAASVRLTTVVMDTDRDPGIAERVVREMALDSSVIAVLGPVFSATSLSAARAARDAGVPLVSPTANANGIAAVGNSVFQANPDYDTRGRAMARYAYQNLGLRKLAVLAPTNSHGRYLAEGFIREARALGARVIGVEWYERGVSDYSSQFRSLRRAGFRESEVRYIAFGGKRSRADLMKLIDLGVSYRKLDSLMNKGGMVSATELLGPERAAMLDSLGVETVVDESRVDSLEYPVEGIDGMYLPISSPEEIAGISSQVVYFNFATTLLGSGEWSSLRELHANRRYTGGIIFESDTRADSGVAFRRFEQGFLHRYKKAPSRNAMYGFDTAALVIGLIREGALTRETLADALTHVRSYEGVHGKVGFTTGRVNGWVAILQFNGDSIVPLGEVQVE
jgi:ABC-type branched-subunit amino acid transport system substrate-binding protein